MIIRSDVDFLHKLFVVDSRESLCFRIYMK